MSCKKNHVLPYDPYYKSEKILTRNAVAQKLHNLILSLFKKFKTNLTNLTLLK